MWCQLQIRGSLSIMPCFLTVMHCDVTLQSGLQLMLEFHACFKEQRYWNSHTTPPLHFAACSLLCLPSSQHSIHEDTSWTDLGSEQSRFGFVQLEFSNLPRVVTSVLVLAHRKMHWEEGNEQAGKNASPGCSFRGCHSKLHPNPLVLAAKLVHEFSLVI